MDISVKLTEILEVHGFSVLLIFLDRTLLKIQINLVFLVLNDFYISITIYERKLKYFAILMHLEIQEDHWIHALSKLMSS